MAVSFHQAPHMDPKLLLQRKLGSAWSSPELVALLQTRPGLLSDVLCIFRGLEQPVRVRECVIAGMRAHERCWSVRALPPRSTDWMD